MVEQIDLRKTTDRYKSKIRRYRETTLTDIAHLEYLYTSFISESTYQDK